ncbi:MAG: hypothetical protein EON61_01310 [Alphaproteobacteria bacterium]|nr:MAG: hypothetical protein EON61_01310 [Alphaproteobacteria bacterium]
MADNRLSLTVIACIAMAAACGENDTRMAGDDPLADAREAAQPSPPPAQVAPAEKEPHGGLSTQPVTIPTNPPEDQNH